MSNLSFNVKCQNSNVKSNPKSKCQKFYNLTFDICHLTLICHLTFEI